MSTTGASTDHDSQSEISSNMFGSEVEDREVDLEASTYERELTDADFAMQPLNEALASLGLGPGLTTSGGARMTEEYLRRLCGKREMYEHALELNEVVYLQQQGFSRVENMNLFRNCVCLFLNNNCISRLGNGALSAMRSLKQIYLNYNNIDQIAREDFEKNLGLEYVNLSNNKIKFIGSLYFLPNLKTLLVANNLVSEMTSLVPLPPSLEALDFSGNPILSVQPSPVPLLHPPSGPLGEVEAGEFLEFCTKNFSSLKQIYSNGCPLVSRVPQFRRRLTLLLPQLCFLDKAPVSPEDRTLAEAWARGGTEEETRVRKGLYEQKRRAMDEVLTNFRAFQAEGVEAQAGKRREKECDVMNKEDLAAQTNAKLQDDIRRILSN